MLSQTTLLVCLSVLVVNSLLTLKEPLPVVSGFPFLGILRKSTLHSTITTPSAFGVLLKPALVLKAPHVLLIWGAMLVFQAPVISLISKLISLLTTMQWKIQLLN